MPFSPAQIADGLVEVIDQLRGVVNSIAGPSAANIETVLNDAQQLLGSFSSTDTNELATVQRVGADLSAVLTALAALPLPPAAVLPVRIASIVLPMLISAADMVWPMQSVAATRMLLEVSTHAA
jgi:hypothetical protein